MNYVRYRLRYYAIFDTWLGPTKPNEKFWEYYFRFGVNPQKGKFFFDLFLTPTKVHLWTKFRTKVDVEAPWWSRRRDKRLRSR